MSTCRLTIKIKDYFPKTDSIPYSNYICLFTCGEYQGQIPFLPDDSKFLQHQLKNITTDIKYKVLILDFNDMTLIGMCEMSIAYKILNRIIPQNGFIQEQQKKLLIDTKTKRKLFGTLINSGDIYLNIYTEVFLVSKIINEQKIKNSKLKKNHPMLNTPKCYIKYNFAVNKSDFSPKSSKNNNKSTMGNSNSEKQTLNLSKQEKDKQNRANKYTSNISINYKKENDKKNLRNYSNYNIINNNINFFNKKSEVDIYNNKKNIMDLLQQKQMMEEIVENYNKGDINEKMEMENEDDYIHNNNLYIKNKEGYLTEQNFNPKIVINDNNNNKIKQIKNIYNINKNNNGVYNNNEEDEEEKQKFLYYSKNTLSPSGIKNMFLDGDNYNMSKTLKNKNYLNPNMNLVSPNFVYNSKNRTIKIGKIYTKGKINDTMKKNINIKNNDKRIKNNIPLYQSYLTNTNFNNNISNNYNTNPYTNSNNYTQSESNINTYNTNTNTYNIYNYNNMDQTSSKNSEDEEDNEDIDRIILEKGAELRNDFHSQIKQYPLKNNNHKSINSLNSNSNSNYLDQNQNLDINLNNIYNSRTPLEDRSPKNSDNKSLNSYLMQEDVKNNCVKLIEFYSLLNLKLKKIYPQNSEIAQKLIIFKELLSSELKKKNIITDKTNKNNFIYSLSTNINETTNQKILNLFPKIKKMENSIYQQLFNVFNTQEELAKFSEFENYDKQTKIFLLLNLARNLVKKYGNISQVYTIKNTINMKKKKTLKKCLQNYLITEKEEGDKDFVNLENINIINRDIQKNSEFSDENKFRVIKEVDEDKEEENDGEEDQGIGIWSEGDEIKEIGDENRDQIIEDADFTDENNNDNNINIINNDKSPGNEHLNEKGEEININGQNNNNLMSENKKNKENIELNNYINIEDNHNSQNNSNNINEINDSEGNGVYQNDIIKKEENKENNSNSKKKENGQNIE